MRFIDRRDAGIRLAEVLRDKVSTNAIVLAVPRGGVPVGYEVARQLHLPLDVVLAKKIGHPFNKEYAIGAVTEDVVMVNEDPDVSEQYIQKEVLRLRETIREKKKMFKGNSPFLSLKNKQVILVDDGIATGYTLLATVKMLREQRPSSIIVAVPVAPISSVTKFREVADELVCLYIPEDFGGVGEFYEDFDQVEDEEVTRLLNEAAKAE